MKPTAAFLFPAFIEKILVLQDNQSGNDNYGNLFTAATVF